MDPKFMENRTPLQHDSGRVSKFDMNSLDEDIETPPLQSNGPTGIHSAISYSVNEQKTDQIFLTLE